LATPVGDIFGFIESTSAAAADAYGVAIDVPDADAYAVGDELHVDRMFTPGAARSTYEP
jgi:hypothetical protein